MTKMKDKTLDELTDEEFETVIENFIEQEAEGTDEMEVSTFFQLWDDIEKKRPKPTIEVEGNIVAPTVALEEGATFNGNIEMRAPSDPAK